MPDPVLVSIAAALAAKTVTSLYDLVKRKFAGKPEQTAALAAAQGAAPGSPEVLALSAELAAAEATDPRFARELREAWGQVSIDQHVDNGGVVNQVTGTVTGKVVQARDIQGGVSF